MITERTIGAINRLGTLVGELRKHLGASILTPPVEDRVYAIEKELAELRLSLGIVAPKGHGQGVSPKVPILPQN